MGAGFTLQNTTSNTTVQQATPLYITVLNTKMDSPRTPLSQSQRNMRAQIEKRFSTDYAYKSRRSLPTKEEVDKHVDDEIRRSRIYGLSDWFKDEVWDLVYDHGMLGVSGPDKERFEALCDSHCIPKENIACRNKVKVGIEQAYR
jgi:hypothetical protein